MIFLDDYRREQLHIHIIGEQNSRDVNMYSQNVNALMKTLILAQPREHNLDYPIYFTSHQLNEVECIYTTIECEGFVMVYAIKKLTLFSYQQVHIRC